MWYSWQPHPPLHKVVIVLLCALVCSVHFVGNNSTEDGNDDTSDPILSTGDIVAIVGVFVAVLSLIVTIGEWL